MNMQASSSSSPSEEEQQKDEPEWICGRCKGTFPGEKRFYCHCQNCGHLLAKDDESASASRSLSAEEMQQHILNLDKEKIINKVTLDNFGITYTEEECEILAEVLQRTTTLEVLQLDRPTALLHEKFRNALGQNRTIKELYLHRSGCGDVGAKALADVLKSNETIELVDLSHNEISDSGTVELGVAFLINKKSFPKIILEDNYEISSPVADTLMSKAGIGIDISERRVTPFQFDFYSVDRGAATGTAASVGGNNPTVSTTEAAYFSPFCLPSDVLREIMQLAGCEIASVHHDFATSSSVYIDTDLKVSYLERVV